MKIARLEYIPVSIPYQHREISSQVQRDGVTDVIVKATTNDGLVGWGESCSGADTESVLATLRAMTPFVVGRSPWESESIRAELWDRAIWLFRRSTACFAYAGIDMALGDLCGKVTGQPLYNLHGGKVRESVDYFYYLSRGATDDELRTACRDGAERGYTVFYLKTGIDIERELEMVRLVRDTLGPKPKIRLDANGAWSVSEALRNLRRLDEWDIDFIEQPVAQDPLSNMQEVRSRSDVAVCANEGMWTAEDAYRQITNRTADVYCFSPYWVGSMAQFKHLALVAHNEVLRVCKHTHGEFGIAAAAAQHILLTLPNIVTGNQQTAHIMADDILTEALPIATGPSWGVPTGVGLGVEVDMEKLARYHEHYRERGQYLPYDPGMIGRTKR